MDQGPLNIRPEEAREEENRRFWVAQLVGWLGFFALALAFNLFRGAPIFISVASAVFAFLSGFALSAAYRNYIKLKRWIERPPFQILLPATLGSLCVSIVWTASFLSFYYAALYLLSTAESFTWSNALAQWINTFVVIFLWNILYFSYHFIQIGQASRVEKYKLEAEARSAQLNLLKAQINPHFMFNALNNIRALTLEDVPRSREMITHLSDILRYSMNYLKTQEVELKQELEIVEQFLELCDIQFEDRLRYRITASEASLNAMVPPMTLQILAENSVKHGIAHLPEGGDVIINASIKDEALHLEVKNSGQLRNQEKTKENNGIGVENIYRRLKLIHGDRASFSLRQEEQWVIASIIIQQKP